MTRLLIIKPSSLGDIVHALQMVARLREGFDGQLEVSWIARDTFAPLVEASPLVDRVFRFYRRDGVAGFFRLMKEVRRERFDCVLDLQGLARTGLMTVASRAERKVGRADAREGARWCYGELVPQPPVPGPPHAVQVLLEFCRVFSVDPVPGPDLWFRSPEGVGDTVAGRAVAAGKNFAVLLPGSRHARKCWPGYGGLTRRLLEEEKDLQVIWAGTEAPPGEMPAVGGRFTDLIGKTSLTELAWLLRHAAVVVANDSGPCHLAVAQGVRTLALFGPTDPVRYGPFPPNRPGCAVVRAPGGRWENLEVETVLEAWKRVASAGVRRGDGGMTTTAD